MNSRWQANKIGLINFWYYDEQEFPFVKGRMLLRGSNGSGKSVTMQSVVPLLLDGNMSPERLDPFGSRDRKMISYLLEEDDGLEERTGYLYLEFKRKDSEHYLTIGMGIRARKGKSLDKWYFSLTDGRRIGKDFFLYKEVGEKVTLSKKELENRIGNGGRVMDRQFDYMEYVNRQIFGFETTEEYKEMIDLLIQLRTPKLSKDFKPSVLNEILSDSLQPLSDEDLRPMSEAIENMDAMNMNLKSRKDAKLAADKIQAVYQQYNKRLLYEKASWYVQAQSKWEDGKKEQEKLQSGLLESEQKIEVLKQQKEDMEAKREAFEKERESLSKSDAVALKGRENQLEQELQHQKAMLAEKERFLTQKQEQYTDVSNQIKAYEDKKYEKETAIEALLEDMENEAETMSFQEHAFMQEELSKNLADKYNFASYQKEFEQTRQKINEGEEVLAEVAHLERQKDDLMKERETNLREIDGSQRKVSELESVFAQTQNEWKEALYQWNGSNQELKLGKALLGELCRFMDAYEEQTDFAKARQMVADVWIEQKAMMETELSTNALEQKNQKSLLEEAEVELKEWENQKEPQPERSEAVVRNRKRLKELEIPYQEFYKVIEFGATLDETACNHLEEALWKMNILDALVIDERYKEQVLKLEKGCEDRYLFVGTKVSGNSLLDVLELNEEVNDIFSNQRLTNILSSIAYDAPQMISVNADGTYQMGVLAGTITGEYEAGFLGTKARERQRLVKIEECKLRIAEILKMLENLQEQEKLLLHKREILQQEYDRFPQDVDVREALKMLLEAERVLARVKQENDRLEGKIRALSESMKEKKLHAVELAEALYLTCSYTVFKEAKKAAEVYSQCLITLLNHHEMYLNMLSYLREQRNHLEDLDEDMEQIRYDIQTIQFKMKQDTEEMNSIQEQLRLTDYEQIKERLDACLSWLHSYPKQLQDCISEQSREESSLEQGRERLKHSEKRCLELEKEVYYAKRCYQLEKELDYVELPDSIQKDVTTINTYLEGDVKALDKDSIVRDLNRVYFENRGFLTDYQLMQTELFTDVMIGENVEGAETSGVAKNLAKRLDIVARYQGVKVPFGSLIGKLQADVEELENLIKDGDRELFEDILANTVSRKIRGKINASTAWVQKMNLLMNEMNTSSGLKLSLRWRSKTAEQEDQLDTKELVELLKKDYRLMSEEEAAKLSTHFRSKVADARRNAGDGSGMISFYQIMKDTLDYRKWFEFQLFSQKAGERVKELTNSVFGTFSGGEKAMSMYVPLFSAVVAKYQGGRSDAPRLISLDEAFAGVDNKNIRDMFRLMTEFQFDFIINSQVLWGDCDTLDALAIYQLIRPINAKFVTVMPYYWNGFKKELLESEGELEDKY